MDPYVLLNVQRGCSVEELKSSFRKISKRVHPDRGGDEHLFKLLSNAFRQVMVELRDVKSDPTHAEMKTRFEGASDAGGVPTLFEGSSPNETMRKFNAFFEKNRLDNPEDEGYGAQMAASSAKRDDFAASQLYAGPYNHDRFNATFDQKVAPPKQKALAVYEEPASAFPVSTLALTELTGRRPDDFGGEEGNLQYVDYMKAHTASRLADASAAPARPQYKSMDDIVASRSAAPTFTSAERSAYLQNVERTKRMAEEEARAVRDRDAVLERHHNMVSRMLQGRR